MDKWLWAGPGNTGRDRKNRTMAIRRAVCMAPYWIERGWPVNRALDRGSEMWYLWTVLKALFVLAAFLVSFPPVCADTSEHRLAFERLRDAVYDQEPLERIESLYRGALLAVEGGGLGERDRQYWLSRVEYMIARAWQSEGEKKRAAQHYERGLRSALRATIGSTRPNWAMLRSRAAIWAGEMVRGLCGDRNSVSGATCSICSLSGLASLICVSPESISQDPICPDGD